MFSHAVQIGEVETEEGALTWCGAVMVTSPMGGRELTL